MTYWAEVENTIKPEEKTPTTRSYKKAFLDGVALKKKDKTKRIIIWSKGHVYGVNIEYIL